MEWALTSTLMSPRTAEGRSESGCSLIGVRHWLGMASGTCLGPLLWYQLHCPAGCPHCLPFPDARVSSTVLPPLLGSGSPNSHLHIHESTFLMPLRRNNLVQ